MGTDQVASAPPGPDAPEDRDAFVELAGWRAVWIRGADARGWLHDLVTADVARMAPGEGRRSLVLTPTGRIRADIHVAADPAGFLLLQDPAQPEPIDRILAPYVLSSDVELRDRTAELTVFTAVGRSAAGAADGGAGAVARWSPSVLGTDAGAAAGSGRPTEALRARLVVAGLSEAGVEAVERRRIAHGIPRMGPDFDASALPAATGLEDTIDFTKGCFLGQESVAKVRNLGHPQTVLAAVRSNTVVSPGDLVVAGGSAVGAVTSTSPDDRGCAAIVRIGWDARDRQLSTEHGEALLRQSR